MTTYDDPPFDPYDLEPVTGIPANTPERAAEQALLGAMILDPIHAIPTATKHLHPTDYQNPHHETLHHVLVQLHDTDQPIDPLTLAAHLTAQPATIHTNGTQRRSLLEQIGGAPYLHTLMQACHTTANADHYAEIIHTAARRRTLQTTAARLNQIATTGNNLTLDTAIQQAYDALDKAAGDFGPAATPPTTWSPVNLERVLDGEYLDPPPTMLRRTDGTALLYDSMVHSISGEPGSGKTWLTLLAALELIQQDQHVVFIDFEDRADRVISRLLALGAHPDQIRTNFAYIRPDRPLDDHGRHQLEPALVGARLAIIDGVTEAMTMHALDLNSNTDVATFLDLLPRWIADHGPAVVLIDHVVKDKEKQGRYAIGGQHKLAGINSAYLIKIIQPFARGKRGVAQIILGKDRPGYVQEQAFGKIIAEFALDATFNNITVIPELTPPGRISGHDHAGQPFEPTYYMEKISAYVATNPGLSKSAIEGAIHGKAATIRLALELLVTKGYIHTTKGPKNAIQHYSHKPYLDTDQPTETDPHTTGDTHPDNDPDYPTEDPE